MFTRIYGCGRRSSPFKYVFCQSLHTLYKREFQVTPFCSVKINLPYNVTVVPLDFYEYPNCDKVIVSVEGNQDFNHKINATCSEDVVDIVSNLSENVPQIVCKIEAPVKANIHALLENGNIDFHNFQGDIIDIQTNTGNIIAGKCICEKIALSSSSGNIICNNILQAAHISLSTGKGGNISTEKLQGLTLLARTVNGNIETKSTYCNDSSFSTEGGSLVLSNIHKNCQVSCGTNGKLHITGFDGTLQAVIEGGDINIDMVRIEGDSKIKIEKEGSLNLKLTEECIGNTNFKLFTKQLDISQDLDVVVDIEKNYKVMKTGEGKVQTEIECPNSNVTIRNLSWREMFNFTKKLT